MTKTMAKRKFFPNSTRVVIYGGFGNQLFGWALAAHLQNSGSEVKLLQAREGVGNKTHGVKATRYSAFGFDGYVGDLAPVWHLLLSLVRRSRFAAHLFRVSFTDSSNFAAATLQGCNARWLVGYHQNLNPTQLLSTRQLSLGVNFSEAPQVTALAARREAARHRYVAVHVRGGDLRYLKETAGLLSPGYFVRAVQCLFSQNNILASTEISVVTDDLEAAGWVCDALEKKGFISSISANANASLSAAFQELSRADYVVISNSSFSYWAAIAGRPKFVAYPSPWRADGKQGLLVPTYGCWTAVKSHWTQEKDLPVGS